MKIISVLAAGFVALTLATGAGATNAGQKQVPLPLSGTGWDIYVRYGPVCTKTSKYCKVYPIPGVKVLVYSGAKLVRSGKTDKSGHVRILSPSSPLAALPGQKYTMKFSGSYNGRAFKHTAKLPTPISGLFFPYTLNICTGFC